MAMCICFACKSGVTWHFFFFKGPLTAYNNVSQESVKISKIMKPGRQS